MTDLLHVRRKINVVPSNYLMKKMAESFEQKIFFLKRIELDFSIIHFARF